MTRDEIPRREPSGAVFIPFDQSGIKIYDRTSKWPNHQHVPGCRISWKCGSGELACFRRGHGRINGIERYFPESLPE